MPRRARNEARERHQERRRNIRKRFIEEFKKAFLRELRKAFRDSIKRYIEDWERTREALTLLRDIVMGRARVVFKVEHVYFFKNKRVYYTYDKLLMSLPEDQRNLVISILQSISTARGLDPRVLEQYPWIKYFLWVFVMYYSKYPCKHNAYAIKLTPVSIYYFGGLRITYYYLRWARAKDVKADPYIARSRSVDFYVTFFRYKYDDDLLNSLLVGDEGTGDWNDKITVIRNDLRESEFQIPLRRAVLQPHWVKYYFAKMIGKPEMYYNVSHCSVYGILERPSKTLKLYMAKNRRLYGTRPRHRIKEILYRSGLRI